MSSYMSGAQRVNDQCIKAVIVHKRDAWNVFTFATLNPKKNVELFRKSHSQVVQKV